MGRFCRGFDRAALCLGFLERQILHNSEEKGELVSKGVPLLESAGYQSEASRKRLPTDRLHRAQVYSTPPRGLSVYTLVKGRCALS